MPLLGRQTLSIRQPERIQERSVPSKEEMGVRLLADQKHGEANNPIFSASDPEEQDQDCIFIVMDPEGNHEYMTDKVSLLVFRSERNANEIM